MTPTLSGTALLNPQVLDDPYPFYRELQQKAPVWRVPDTDVHVVTSYALLEEVTRRVDDFSSNLLNLVYRAEGGLPACFPMGDTGTQVLATADAPEHQVHRGALLPFFTPKRLSLLETEIESIASDCIDGLLRKGSADFMAEVANRVPITVIDRVIGFEGADLDQLLQAAFDSTAVVGGALTEAELMDVALRAAGIFEWVSQQFEQASAAGDSILSALRTQVESGALQQEHAIAMVHLLLAAGGESTVSLIGNAVRLLAADQPLQQYLRAHPERIAEFLEEVLRFESPFRSHLRSVPRDTQLGGVTIPAGSVVLLFWAAGNRDPDAFGNPDQFDIERPRKHMAFGRGPHMCLGAPLARLEARTVLRLLLARSGNIALAAGGQPEWVESLQVRRHETLPVTCL